MNSIFMHWLIIILGTFILSVSVSNPLYRLVVGKLIKLNTFLQIILRMLIFFIGLIAIFVGLYFESV